MARIVSTRAGTSGTARMRGDHPGERERRALPRAHRSGQRVGAATAVAWEPANPDHTPGPRRGRPLRNGDHSWIGAQPVAEHVQAARVGGVLNWLRRTRPPAKASRTHT